MKSYYLLLILIFSSASAISQMVLQDPVTARVFSTEKYSEIKGSPFLFKDWTKGSVTTLQGRYDNLELKFDVYDNTLYFNKEDKLFEFKDEVKSFVLMPKQDDSSSYLYFVKGFTAEGLNSRKYIQVLSEGKLSFYKSDIRLLSELNEINKGIVKSFSNATRYYIAVKGELHVARLSKNDILPYFKDKEQQINSFMETNKLGFKKEQDIKKIIDYYNSL